MARYCVELVERTQKYILHQQHCITYPNVDLLTLPRVTNIGSHADFSSAQLCAQQDYEASVCWFCCPEDHSSADGFVHLPRAALHCRPHFVR